MHAGVLTCPPSTSLRTIARMMAQYGIHAALFTDFGTLGVLDRTNKFNPNTNLPPDILTGFLPPEDGSGRGMGSITYIVEPKTGLVTGSQLHNVAFVTFLAPNLSRSRFLEADIDMYVSPNPALTNLEPNVVADAISWNNGGRDSWPTSFSASPP